MILGLNTYTGTPKSNIIDNLIINEKTVDFKEVSLNYYSSTFSSSSTSTSIVSSSIIITNYSTSKVTGYTSNIFISPPP